MIFSPKVAQCNTSKGHQNQFYPKSLQDSSEDFVAQMWRRVALCSREKTEQLQAYQNAIEALVVSFLCHAK